MRNDTKEICDRMDEAADLVKANKLADASRLLAVITRLLIQWVERHLNV